MSKDIFPQTTPDLAAARKKLAPHIHDAFTAFSERVFAEGALPTKTKQLIAEMRAGAAYAHSVLALDTIEEVKARQQSTP